MAAVVVTYNRKEYLADLLPSLLGQTRPLQAIYVVDNASTDGTAGVPRRRVRRQPRGPADRPDREHRRVRGLQRRRRGRLRRRARLVLADGRRRHRPAGRAGRSAALHPTGRLHPRPPDRLPRRCRSSGSPGSTSTSGIPLPYLRDPFATARTASRPTPGCSRGCSCRGRWWPQIGPPDPRFFITWDDAVYALLASRVTKVLYVDHFALKRQREQRQVSLAVRHLNDGSDLFRYHVMRNRGYMAHYLKHLGTYHRGRVRGRHGADLPQGGGAADLRRAHASAARAP